MSCILPKLQRDITSSLAVLTDSTSEPVTLQQVKDHLYLTHGGQDNLLNVWISAARAECEKRTNRTFLTKALRYNLDRFPSGNRAITLPAGPVNSISSLKYYDLDEVQQTWSSGNYRIDTTTDRLTPAVGVSYPSTAAYTSAIEITYFAGFAASESAWESADAGQLRRVQAAICLIVEHWFRNRGEMEARSITKDSPTDLAVNGLLSGLVNPFMF